MRALLARDGSCSDVAKVPDLLALARDVKELRQRESLYVVLRQTVAQDHQAVRSCP